MELVTLTIVHDEAEADILCGMLRVNNVECSYRKTDVAAGAWTLGFGRAGPIEILVGVHDLEAARALLPPRRTSEAVSMRVSVKITRRD